MSLRCIILGAVILLIAIAGGFVAGFLARGGEAANERERAEKYLAELDRARARAGELESIISGLENDIGESRSAYAVIRREIDKIRNGIESGAQIVERAIERNRAITEGLQRLSQDSKAQSSP